MMPQAKIDHPLAPFGYRRPPFWLWRTSQRLYVGAAAIIDIWLIITGRLSLHRAYQAGYDHGSQAEWRRVILNMGDIEAQRANVKKADVNRAASPHKIA